MEPCALGSPLLSRSTFIVTESTRSCSVHMHADREPIAAHDVNACSVSSSGAQQSLRQTRIGTKQGVL